MDYRQLGASGLRVSALTLGTMTFGGRDNFASVGSTDVDGARRQLDLCLDRGINFVDTANVYSGGLSEEILGKAIEGRRDRLLLATKARMAMGDGANDAGLSRHHLIAECEASLRRLGADHIDLYQVHEWDGQTPLEETMEALDTLVRSGKVRYVGASNYTGWQLMKALGTADRHGYQRFVTQQIYYSLQARDAEYELVPIAVDQGVGILVWSPLAGGLLSGKYRRDQQGPEGSRQLSDWNEPPVRDREQLYDVVDALVEIGEGHGVSAAQVALAWLLRRPGIVSLIVGARTDEQLTDNLAAAELDLSDGEYARLEELSRPPLIYPHWHQAKTCRRPAQPGRPGAARTLRLTSGHARERAVRRHRTLPARAARRGGGALRRGGSAGIGAVLGRLDGGPFLHGAAIEPQEPRRGHGPPVQDRPPPGSLAACRLPKQCSRTTGTASGPPPAAGSWSTSRGRGPGPARRWASGPTSSHPRDSRTTASACTFSIPGRPTAATTRRTTRRTSSSCSASASRSSRSRSTA